MNIPISLGLPMAYLRRLFEPSFLTFHAFLGIGIILSVWLATKSARKSTINAIRRICTSQELCQLIIGHRPDAVCVGLWLFSPMAWLCMLPIFKNRSNTFAALIGKLICFFFVVSTISTMLSHNHSPFGAGDSGIQWVTSYPLSQHKDGSHVFSNGSKSAESTNSPSRYGIRIATMNTWK